jgi:tetratricopeptide (TPR) repeat protein
MKVLLACDDTLPFRFKLPTILDIETRGQRLRTPGSEASYCLKNATFLKHINEAIYFLKKAVEMDPTYLPARVNVSSVLIMAGEYSNAISVTDEILKIQPQNSEALNNKAVALYVFGRANNLDTADHSIEMLRGISTKNPSFSDALYNMASIQSERGRNVSATETWKKFIKVEPTGIYAQVVREKIGMKADDKRAIEKVSEMKPPIKLGEIKGETEKALRGMKKKEFAIGPFIGVVYEGGGIKVFAIDNTVEIVETEPEKEIDIRKAYGEPVKKIKTLYGLTLVYNSFAIDVVGSKVKKIVYFKREVI